MATKKIEVQRYDHNIQLFFHITNNGVVEPINGATVYLKIRNSKTQEKVKRQVTIVDPELAECLYVLTKEDLSTIGFFVTEVETHYANGTILSTLESPFTLEVLAEIVDDKTEPMAMILEDEEDIKEPTPVVEAARQSIRFF